MLFAYNHDLAAAAASPLMTESAEALASASLWAGLGLLVIGLLTIATLVIGSIKELAQTRRFQGLGMDDPEEVIECLGLEDISAQEYIDLGLDQDDGLLEVETAHVEIHDNVVYLQCGEPEQDVVPMESEGITLKDNVQMAVWSCRRGFRTAVKYVRDLAAAPARIAELEAEIAKLEEEKKYDFDFYSEDEDNEIVTWVNKA